MERLEDGLMSPKAPACATDTGESAAHLSLQGSKNCSVSGSAAVTSARTAHPLITWALCACSTVAVLLTALLTPPHAQVRQQHETQCRTPDLGAQTHRWCSSLQADGEH